MKKSISFILTIIMILSISTMAFADDNLPSVTVVGEIPTEVIEEFIDLIPDGHYLKKIEATDDGNDMYGYSALYLPLVQTASSEVSGSKYKKIYNSDIAVAIFNVWIYGEFNVAYDGSAAECSSASCDVVYTYNNRANGAYGAVQLGNEYALCMGENATAYVPYKWYWGSTLIDTYVGTASIGCSPYGEIY